MAAVRVRDAREVDVPAIEHLVLAAFSRYAERMTVAPAPVTADYATLVSAHGCAVAERDGRVVGVLVRWPHPDHVYVETLAVAPEAQGGGIGALLLATAEDEAAAAGLDAVRLHTNAAMTENLEWYPRHGYVRTGRSAASGFDRVAFEKLLPAT
jgi:ribosomal protein S18 acetylase RimI-like enzyme